MDFHSLLAEISANDNYRSSVVEWFDMEQHPYGWLSLMPPLVAILLAVLTRRILISLFLAVLTGSLILTYHDAPGSMEPTPAALNGLIPGQIVDLWNVLLGGLADAWNDHLWPSLIDPSKVSVFLFTCLMGAIVGMVNRAAGMRGLLQLLSPLTGSVRKAQIVAWFSGMLVFFDDYANTLLLGTTFRSMFDRLKISREKLAYIVDSTAAPVAGLAIVSTWIAGEIDYIKGGVENGFDNPDSINAFDLFLQSIPYRFYVLWALFFVVLLAITKRDFGPMLKAEVRTRRKSRATGSEDENAEFLVPQDLDWDRMELQSGSLNQSTVEALAVAHDPTLAPMGTKSRSLNAIAPVFVTVVAILGFMFHSGYQSVGPLPPATAVSASDNVASAPANNAESEQETAEGPVVEAVEDASRVWETTIWLRDVFGNADSYGSLVYGSLVGFFFTLIWLGFQRIVPASALSQAAGTGAAHMVPALMVLWLASTLATMTSKDPTAAYEAQMVEANNMARAIAGVSKTPKFADMDLANQIHETLHLHKFDREVIVETVAPAYENAQQFAHNVTERVTSSSPDGAFFNRYLFQDGKQVDWDSAIEPGELPTYNPKDEQQSLPPVLLPVPEFDAPPAPVGAPPAGLSGSAVGGFPRGNGGPAVVAAGSQTNPSATGNTEESSESNEEPAPAPAPNNSQETGQQLDGNPEAAPAGGSRPSGGMGQQVRPTEPDFSNVWEPDGNLEFPFSDFRHRLHTGQYLSSLLTRQAGDVKVADHPLIPWLPTIIFVLAGFTAFATGSSWGTMGIVMPLAIPLATSLLAGANGMDPSHPVFLATIGSVLAGAVFGDHCSPISDTTVLSSQASGCDHLAHVWTQLPYAMAVGLVTILFGTIPVGFGVPWQVSLVVGTVALIVIAIFMGRTADSVIEAEEANADSPS